MNAIVLPADTRSEPSSVEVLPHGAPPLPAAEPTALAVAEVAIARSYADASTQRAYTADWRRFASWCATRGLESYRGSGW